MDIFLDALAESSNVAASARAADIAANAMYRERRRNPGFAARWHEALCEGFARLKAELLSEALIAPTGNVKDATLKSRAQKYRLRSEEHTSELQSLMRISYAGFCLKKKNNNTKDIYH